MKAFLLLALYYGFYASAGSGSPQKGRFLSACERALVNWGYIHPVDKAQFQSHSADYRIIGDQIEVRTADQEVATPFTRTARGLSDLRFENWYPKSFTDISKLKGLKVLDLACGDGQFVEDLNFAGVDAIGLDIHLTKYQRSKPYFVQSSAEMTGLPDGAFDIVYVTQGPLTYRFEEKEFTQKLLREIHRVLKKGGVLRASPFAFHRQEFSLKPRSFDQIFQGTGLETLPRGLRVKAFPETSWFATPIEDAPVYWLEIERFD